MRQDFCTATWLVSAAVDTIQIDERYDANSAKMNKQARLQDERSQIMADYASAMRAGEKPSKDVLDRMAEFNLAHPRFAILPKNIKQSYGARCGRPSGKSSASASTRD